MLSGDGFLTADELLLKAIADVFDIPPQFLTEWGEVELPTRVQSNLEAIQALRLERLIVYATRALGQLTPESIELLKQVVDQAMPHQGLLLPANLNTAADRLDHHD